MQATPTIPATPAGAALSAGSTGGGGKTATDGQFRQHLTAAGKNSAKTKNTAKTKGQQEPAESKTISSSPQPEEQNSAVETENASTAAEQTQDTAAQEQTVAEKTTAPADDVPEAELTDTMDEFSDLAARELILSLLADQSQKTDMPDPGTDKTAKNTALPPALTPAENPAQNPQILSLSESVQIPGPPDALLQVEKPVITLSSLLKENTALPTTPQEPATGAEMVAPAKAQASNTPGQTDLSIENWRAQFSYQRTPDSRGDKTQPITASQLQNQAEGLVKEPVLAYASQEFEQATAPTRARSGSGVELPNERRDSTSNFIHANLPSVNTKVSSDPNSNAGKQQGEGQQQQTPADGILQSEQTGTTKTGLDAPLIFSLNQEGTPGLSTAGQQTTATQMLRLPSGTEVPQSQILDQVINKFTLNRTLESGSITLKLHPAELGELRMEIKVEQDNIRAHITTQNPQVQEILDRHLPKLKEALAQQGLNLDHMEVTVATDKDNNPQNFQEHFNRQQEGRPTRSGKDHVQFALDQEALKAETTITDQQSLSVLA